MKVQWPSGCAMTKNNTFIICKGTQDKYSVPNTLYFLREGCVIFVASTFCYKETTGDAKESLTCGQNWFGILKITHSVVFKDSFLSAAEKSCWWPTSSQRCRAWRYGVRRVSWVIWTQGRWWKQHKLYLRSAIEVHGHGVVPDRLHPADNTWGGQKQWRSGH